MKVRDIFLRQNISSGASNCLLFSLMIKVECNSAIILLWEKTEKKRTKNTWSNSGIEKKTATIDILQNHYNYPTVCFLLDTAHRIDHCINVCSKWIFDSNLEYSLPLTKVSLNYICSGNDTDEITFVGVLHAIRAVPPIVVQIKLKI